MTHQHGRGVALAETLALRRRDLARVRQVTGAGCLAGNAPLLLSAKATALGRRDIYGKSLAEYFTRNEKSAAAL
jgi:hypothetical protein